MSDGIEFTVLENGPWADRRRPPLGLVPLAVGLVHLPQAGGQPG